MPTHDPAFVAMVTTLEILAVVGALIVGVWVLYQLTKPDAPDTMPERWRRTHGAQQGTQDPGRLDDREER